MKKLTAVLALAAGFFVAGTTFAQPASSLRGRTVRQLPGCRASNEGTTVSIIDATSQDVIGTGGGTAITVAVCDGEDFVPISATVANLDGNPSIVLDTDDSGSDITLTPADDLILTPVDALTISAGGVVLLDNTGGATTTLDTDAAGSDIVLTPADDLLLSPVDALTVASGGAASITTTSGAIGLTAAGATNDVTLTAADDVILAATDDTTIAGDQLAVGTTTAIIDAGGGADEVTIAAASTVIIGTFQLTKSTAPPVACAAGTEGALYFDSDLHALCGCNASAWVEVADGSTGCS